MNFILLLTTSVGMLRLALAIDYYPLTYGGYNTQYFQNNSNYMLPFWYVQNIEIYNLDLFLNGDYVANFLISKGNLPEPASSTILPFENILVRIDHEIGRIIWAKSFQFNGFSDQLEVLYLTVQNDVIYTVNEPRNNDSKSGIIIVYSSDGNLIESYSLVSQVSDSMFYWLSATFNTDGSYIASWFSLNFNSGLGVNINSTI